jgi:fructokinase
MQVRGIGEVLWDIFPDQNSGKSQERFGGAALNFCANLQRLGDNAILISAVGEDPRGALALRRMQKLGLDTSQIAVVKSAPTGIATVHTSPDGEPNFVIPRPAAFDLVSIDPEDFTKKPAEWLYFGTLLQTQASIEEATTTLVRQSSQLRCFYDMNLRTGHWNIALVQRLSRLASIVKLNEVEAETLFKLTSNDEAPFSVEQFCREWASAFDVDVICVSLGAAGCCVYDRGRIHTVAGFPVKVCDTVGSGDAFAAAFLHGYGRGWPTLETARFANALGALVASRSGATPKWTLQEVCRLAGPSSLQRACAPQP